MQTSQAVRGHSSSRVVTSPRVLSSRTLLHTPVTLPARPLSVVQPPPSLSVVQPPSASTVYYRTLPVQHHINLSPVRA